MEKEPLLEKKTRLFRQKSLVFLETTRGKVVKSSLFGFENSFSRSRSSLPIFSFFYRLKKEGEKLWNHL